MGRTASGTQTARRHRPLVWSRLANSSVEFPARLWLLMGGTLIYATGVDMCYPFETLYLNGSLHISITTIGLVLGICGLAGLPFQLLGGAFADRFGRRGVLVLGICGSMTLYIGLGLAHALIQVIIVFSVEAAFGWSMFITATNAMVADLTAATRRAEAFGIERMAINVGMIGGPSIALLFLGAHPDYRALFIAAGGVCGVFLLIVLLRIGETRPTLAAPQLNTGLAGYGHILRDRRFLLFSCVTLLPLYGFGQIWSTFPVALHDALGITANQWAKLLLVWALGASILQYPVVRLMRALDPLLLLAAASAALGLGLSIATLAPRGWPTFALMLVVSLGVVLLIPMASTIVAALAPVELRGRYMSAWTIVYLGGSALGPIFGGYAISALGAKGAFLIVGAAGLCGAALFPLLRLTAGWRPLPASERPGDGGLERPVHVP
jgi:MFS family permease